MQEKLQIEVARKIFRNEQNAFSIYLVREIRFGKPYRELTVRGDLPLFEDGTPLQLTGEWMNHQKYGRYFQVKEFHRSEFLSAEAIERFLQKKKIPHLGPKSITKLTKKYGKDLFHILENHPERIVADKILPEVKAKKLIQFWQEEKDNRDLELFFSQHALSLRFIPAVQALFPKNTVFSLQQNPYLLALKIRGIGFSTADSLAMGLAIPPDSVERVKAGVVSVLKDAEDRGHCFLEMEIIQDTLISLLGLDLGLLEPRLKEAFEQLESQSYIMTEGPRVYRMAIYLAEKEVASFIAGRLDSSKEADLHLEGHLDDILRSHDLRLDPVQRQAVLSAVQSPLFILTGGPGVGKTTTANLLIKLLKRLGRSVALCAPTGRAAKRLSEVSGESAQTLHRLLKINLSSEQESLFSVADPLEYQVVLVDECSMIDIELAASLVTAIPDHCQLILIGDQDQLPAVGPGRFFGDLFEFLQTHTGKKDTAPQFTKLSTVHRQAQTSQIIRIAHSFNEGYLPEFDNRSDCKFIDADSPEQVVGVIEQLYRFKLPEMSDINLKTDVQVLSPMKKGLVGTDNLNDLIRNILIPVRQSDQRFCQGDKVIQTVNNYELEIYNGDIGTIEFFREGSAHVLFEDRLVVIPVKDQLDLQLAYAITIHKSQGSEFPVVIIPVTMAHYIMLERNLFYTALTRAKRLAVFVGQKRALLQALKNQKSQARNTGLQDRLSRL